MNSTKRQKDGTLKDELPRMVGAQYATGSSVHGIFQAGVLEWDAIAFSKKYMKLLLFFIIISHL